MSRIFPRRSQRLAEGRPVLSREALLNLGARILAMATAPSTTVRLEHTARMVTRIANGEVLLTDDGDMLRLTIGTSLESLGYPGGAAVTTETNYLDEETLQRVVARAEAMARDQILPPTETLFPPQPPVQDPYLPVALWHESTVRAMREARETVVPQLLSAVKQASLQAAGFVGFMAQSSGFVSKGAITAYAEETDSELAVSAHTSDGKSSGWAGQAARDWTRIAPEVIVTQAVDLAKRGVGAQAVEPGRRTAILTAEAVAQLFRYFGHEYDANQTVFWQATPFSKPPRSARYGEQMFDARIRMSSDPADPEGGFRPWLSQGFANPAMIWAEHGKLKELAYSPNNAALFGRPYAEDPYALRVSGGTTSLEAMIAQCQEGIFVNRFTGVDLIDSRTGMLTGVTCDGCFLVKHGKLDRPVKNFRILESPFFMLNNIVAMGVPKRAAFGFTPPSTLEPRFSWPRRPMIVPPLMVNDFNFVSLIDAV